MSWYVGGLIQAEDFNNLVGPSNTPSTGQKLNTLWGVGNGRYGYGQTPISNVTANATIEATSWDSLINTLNTIAYHQQGVTAQKTGTSTAGSATILMADTTNVTKGLYITGSTIKTNILVKVSSVVTNTSITIDSVAIGTGSVTTTFQFTVNPPIPAPYGSGSLPAGITSPDKVGYLSAIRDNILTAYTKTNYAKLQGTTSTNIVRVTGSPWLNQVTFTHIVTFESGDKARYFFNAGGQLAINFTHAATGTAIDTLFNQLATSCGTIYLSAPPYGVSSAEIAGTSYYGTTRIGGSGNALASSVLGYYDLTTTDQTIFKKYPTSTAWKLATYYLNSFIEVKVKSNGTQGNNADAGSVITITTVWRQSPPTLYIQPGNNTGPVNNSTTTLVVKNPSSTVDGGFLTKSWGNITVTSSFSGN